MFRRICWPWCDCRQQRRAIRREIRAITRTEAVACWIPPAEEALRERLRQQLKRDLPPPPPKPSAGGPTSARGD